MIRAEELGFHSVWMEEHYSTKDHCWPSPLPVLAGFATRTSQVRLGTDILVFPFYHPVRLAEDVALLDIMSNGRFVLGTTIGYKPDEFAPCDTPLEKRGARFVEVLASIVRRTVDTLVAVDLIAPLDQSARTQRPAQAFHQPG
ncbi:MAG: LLM class flavin-dependent oxidoreductase [Gammaproteobacteria bacterium]